MSDLRPWFERFPDLEAWELDRFQVRQLPAAVDETRRGAGQLVIETVLPYDGAEVPVTVTYPSEYPELPPTVYGPQGLLDRHQHLFGANFCLLERPIDDWKAKEWGAADLIAEQLVPLLRDTEAGSDVVRAHEAPMPEPVSAFFRYAADAAVIVPGNLASPRGQSGALQLGRITPHLFVLTALDNDPADDALRNLFPFTEVNNGKWLRVEAPPQTGGGDAQEVTDWIRENHPDVLARPVPRKLMHNSRVPSPPAIELVGLVFAEEGPAVGEMRDGWMFLCIDRTQGHERRFLFHAQVLSPTEWSRRTPELEGLGESRVAIVGTGSVGGDVAVALARAGVAHLDLVDFDRFEATNAVRHTLSIDSTGQPKAQAVAAACRRVNPWCAPVPHYLRLGDDAWNPGESPLERLGHVLESANLVIEASGSHQIAQFVARMAADADIPLVAGWVTDGSWGAEIVRIRPDHTCCWTCFATRLRSGALPLAEHGPSNPVVVQGCSHPTVAGAGFDAAETAMMITRLAVATLAPNGGYPDLPWDYAAVNFRRAAEDVAHPRMRTIQLEPTPECPACQTSVGLTPQR